MISRRTITRAAWTAPVVALATTAPAYATSSQPITCTPSAFKAPGEPSRKTYFVRFDCTRSDDPATVTIDGQPAVLHPSGWWVLTDQRDSSSPLPVAASWADGGSWVGVVKFLPGGAL